MGDAKEQTNDGAQGEDDYDLQTTYEALNALESVTITPEAPESDKRCGICSSEFSIGYKATKLPCSHVFHEFSCIIPWLRQHCYCPVCRYKLPNIPREFLSYCNHCEYEYLLDPSSILTYDCPCRPPSNSTSS